MFGCKPDPTPPAAEPALQMNLDSEASEDTSQAGLPLEQRFDFAQEPPPPTLEIPGLIHTFLFFALALFIIFVGELITVGIGRKLPPFRHENFESLASDPRLMIPAQAIQYAILIALTAMIFRALWQQPFWRAIQWNATAAGKRWVLLVGVGLVLGIATGFAGNYLPMPKEAPILNDLMHSTTGAWLMFIFGSTGAPLVEELGFRGFLLPSLVNIVRRLRRDRKISAETEMQIGIPMAILLTSLPFAMLHSLQVSYAWAPVLLIGIVSAVLCLVRLITRSLAASTLVHSAYNFTLFAGMLFASDGFRHLEKLNN